MTAEWYRARDGEVCGFCREPQRADAPMRRLRSTGIRCAACAKRLLGEDVPGHLQDGAPPAAPTFERRAPPMLTDAELKLASRAPDVSKPKARNR